jgi:hypothetical protein
MNEMRLQQNSSDTSYIIIPATKPTDQLTHRSVIAIDTVAPHMSMSGVVVTGQELLTRPSIGAKGHVGGGIFGVAICGRRKFTGNSGIDGR